MGECLSICQRNENEENEAEDKHNHKNIPCPERTKKNKTRIPKGVISDESEDDDIPITKHISNTIDSDHQKSKNLFGKKEKEIDEINAKIKIAQKNWGKLIDKLIQNRIDILREIVKKEKMDNKSESDSEEDEKLEDIAGRKNRKASTHTQKKNIISESEIFEEKNQNKEKEIESFNKNENQNEQE